MARKDGGGRTGSTQFMGTAIYDTLHLYSEQPTSSAAFDLSGAHFPSEPLRKSHPSWVVPSDVPRAGRIVLHTPTSLRLQLEHLWHLAIATDLSYFKKRDV